MQRVVRWIQVHLEEVTVILTRFQRYNPSFKTRAWKILSANPGKEGEGEETLLTVGIPERGIRILAAISNKAYYEIGEVSFR